MPGLSTLQDTFNDGVLDTLTWSGSYGSPDETGGRARIPCTTGYAGLKSAAAYTLTGNALFVRVYPPAASGAASSTISLLVLTATTGTDAGFLIDTAANAVGIYLHAAGADPSPVFLTYSATSHAWLRLRESAGTLYWETSADGLAWTTRRTAATPGWAADTNLAFVAEAHRDAGTANVAELDNVNVAPVQIIAVPGAGETDAPQSPHARKTAPLASAAETNTATTVTRRKIFAVTAATEADAPRPFGRSKVTTIAQAADIGTAPPLTTVKRAALVAADEADEPRSVHAQKHALLTTTTETDQARPLPGRKMLLLTAAGESETTQPFRLTKQLPLGPATETSSIPPFTAAKRRTLVQAGELSFALALTVGSPLPDDIAYSIGAPAGHWTVSAPWT